MALNTLTLEYSVLDNELWVYKLQLVQVNPNS